MAARRHAVVVATRIHSARRADWHILGNWVRRTNSSVAGDRAAEQEGRRTGLGLRTGMGMEAEEHRDRCNMAAVAVVVVVVVAAGQAQSSLLRNMVACLLEDDAWRLFDWKEKRFSNLTRENDADARRQAGWYSREYQKADDGDQDADAENYPSAPIVPWLAGASIVPPSIATAVSFVISLAGPFESVT